LQFEFIEKTFQLGLPGMLLSWVILSEAACPHVSGRISPSSKDQILHPPRRIQNDSKTGFFNYLNLVLIVV